MESSVDQQVKSLTQQKKDKLREIADIDRQILELKKNKFISYWIDDLELSEICVDGEYDESYNRIYEWGYRNITAQDITILTGDYVAKRATYVSVCTCGYLKDIMVVHANEYFQEKRGPDHREISDDCKSLFLSPILSSENLLDFFRDHEEPFSEEHSKAIKRYIILKVFLTMGEAYGYEQNDQLPHKTIDGSTYDR